MQTDLDPRGYPVRADLAASFLRDQVARERYADGVNCKVGAAVVALRAAPDAATGRISELLFGEIFTVYDDDGSWAWGQCQTDGYVGYARSDSLTAPIGAASHEVVALRSTVYTEPDLKTEPVRTLHMTSRVVVTDLCYGFVRTDAGGWIYRQHLAEIGQTVADPVVTARRFLETPYLWGGRSALGLDCSALVQLAFARSGRSTPRDSDQQERSVGRMIDGGVASAVPGDLFFLKGHVAILSAPGTVIHANAHHMAVAEEPLGDFLARIASMNLAVTSIRRV